MGARNGERSLPTAVGGWPTIPCESGKSNGAGGGSEKGDGQREEPRDCNSTMRTQITPNSLSFSHQNNGNWLVCARYTHYSHSKSFLLVTMRLQLTGHSGGKEMCGEPTGPGCPSYGLPSIVLQSGCTFDGESLNGTLGNHNGIVHKCENLQACAELQGPEPRAARPQSRPLPLYV